MHMFYDLDEVLTLRGETSAKVVNMFRISSSNYRSILQCFNKWIFVNGHYIFHTFLSISIFHIKRLHIEVFVHLSPSDIFLQLILNFKFILISPIFQCGKQSSKTVFVYEDLVNWTGAVDQVMVSLNYAFIYKFINFADRADREIRYILL